MDSELRLYLSKQAYPIYKQNYGDGKLFSQMSDMYFWCVVLGYKNSLRQIPPKLGKQRQGEIHFGAFDDDIQKPFLKMIAVEATGDFNIIVPDPKTKGFERFKEIIQSYAELGFTIFHTQMGKDYKSEKLIELLIDNFKN